MAKLAYHFYELQSKTPLGARSRGQTRHGALLRAEFRRGDVGYADIHPWAELGDLPLGEQLARLARGETTDLTRASLAFAALDAEARSAERSLWDGLTVPASHFLLVAGAENWREALEAALAEGFTRFKIKVGKDLPAEKRLLLELGLFFQSVSPIDGDVPRLRLDYNETLTHAQFADYVSCLKAIRPFLDFIEDPFPFEAALWADLSILSGIDFALDRAASESTVDFGGTIIHKPARTGPFLPSALANLAPGRRLIVTSYLDHPFGQLCAAWVAARLPPEVRDERHGLVSHRVYAPTRFSDRLGWCGPDLCLPIGHGFGFDDELAATEWNVLTS